MAVRGCTVAELHLTDPAAAGFAFAFRVAPCRSHAGVFDSFHSQQQPVQQQHGGWQQQPQNQQHGGWQQQPQNQQHGGWQQQPQNQQHRGWQQQPQNQQHGGWQQQPQNQQQSPNQQHGGWQQQPPNQQQHGGPQQPPSSNEQQATDSQHHAASKEQNDEQTDKADGDADDQEVEPVAPPKEAESKKKLAEEKAAEAKLKERNEEESKEKEAKAKEEEREKEKIEDKAKEMLKNLPAIPEDDQANHRSWESQLSSKDVKSQMETSREMDALRNKQHAGAFYTEAALFPARRPRSGFLHFEAATAPPQHIASGSARASGLREEGNANHRSWEAQLTAEQLKQQMTQSRERDSLQGSDSSSSTDAQNPQTGASSWTSSGAGASGARRGARRGKAGSSHGASGDGGDGGADGEDQGDKADKADKGVEVEIEPEGATGTASRPVLLPVIRQLGESIGLNGHWKNDVLGINLAMKNSRTPKFFCGSPGALPVALQEDDHPSIEFRYPVKNVSVELTDLGQDGKGEKEVIWSATYSTEKPITILSGKLRPDGGDQTAYKPPCYVPKTKNRLELRVIADDPLDGTAAEVRAEAIHKKRTERSIDEVADLEVQLVDRDDPMMLERFRKEAPAAHYFGGTGGAGGAGVSGTAGTRSAAAGVAAAAAAAAADGEDEFSFAGRAPGGGFDVDSGAFGSAEEAEAYGQMLMDLAKYKKMGPYVASMAPLPVALMEDRSWRSWKSTRQALSLFL